MSGFPPILDDAGLAEYVERLRSLGVPVDALSEPAEHDERALEENPRWLLLNYESRAEKRAKGVSPKWYEGKGGCEKPRPEGDSCDEYPFFSSEQGGPEAEAYPSIEWISEIDNETQGRRYGNFVVACKLAKGALFAAVPLKPSLGIPTFYLCNNGT